MKRRYRGLRAGRHPAEGPDPYLAGKFGDRHLVYPELLAFPLALVLHAADVTCTDVLGVVTTLVLTAAPAAQQLGHKLMGSLGLYAGTQPDAGLYVLNQFGSYGSNDIYDRYEHRIPVNLDLDAVANFVGFQATFRLWYSLYIPHGSGGIGLGQWTHEFSFGGTVYFDRAKTWRFSSLASYD